MNEAIASNVSNVCSICKKIVAVALYLRVRPIVKGTRVPKSAHRFFGFWPPESHLVEYIKTEMMIGAYLNRLWENNCKGHSIDDIVEAIEQLCPPETGIPIKILWNPGTKVTPYLLAETPAQRAQLRMEAQQDLRTVLVSEKTQVRLSILYLLNNTVSKPQASLSLPGAAVSTYDTPYAAKSWTPQGAAERAAQIEEANRRFVEEFIAASQRPN